jgi:hypothetical protein
LRKAATGRRAVLLHFTLENCPPCDAFDRDVARNADWLAFRAAHVLETTWLFRQGPGSGTWNDPETQKVVLLGALGETRAARASGAKQGFPYFAVLDPAGHVLAARAGYDGSGAEAFIRWIRAGARL